MSDYRFQIVKRYEAHTGDELACLHVMIDNNSHVEIAHTYIPLDDIQKAMKEYKVTLAVTGIEAAPIELHDQA